jgi:hypothetical protein
MEGIIWEISLLFLLNIRLRTSGKTDPAETPVHPVEIR